MAKYVLYVTIFLLLFVSTGLNAQTVPQFIHYQGNLANADGDPVNNNLLMIFRVFDVSENGTFLWEEVRSSVPVSGGLFSVILGETVAFPADLFSGQVYLEIQISQDILAPRQKIGSVAFALTSDTVRGISVDENGNVGIGTSNPQADLDVEGDLHVGGKLLPDYDSGWVADNNGTRHRTIFTHNLGDFPSRMTIWFSPTNSPAVVYPLNWKWGEEAGNPVTIEITGSQLILNIFNGAALHGTWNGATGQWTLYNNGFWKVLLWR